MVDLLIIGKNGQLGSALSKIAKSRKLSFEAYSKEMLDITKKKSLSQAIQKRKPKVIINTSAYHVISECEQNPEMAFIVNCTAVANLARIAKDLGAKFVTYSTNYVFDGNKRSPYFEEDRPRPLQMYGLSKLAGEFAALNDYGEGTYIIRTSGVYGKGKLGSRSKKGNFILKILDEAKKKKTISASKNQIVNPTYAEDLAISTINLLNTRAVPGTYHLTNEGAISWYEFAKSIIAFNNMKNKIEPLIEKEFDYKKPRYTVLANRNAKKYGIVLPEIEGALKRYLKEL